MIASASHLPEAAASPIGSWTARFKLPSLFLLIFAFASVKDLVLLPFVLLVAFFIFLLSGLRINYLIERMRLPGIFLLFMAILLPFWSGQTILWQLGPLALRQEGLLGILTITVKFISIFTVALALFATTPLAQLTAGMRTIGIPWLLTDLLIFTYRYIFQIAADFHKMRTSARLRGFRNKNFKAVKSLANITGTMLVRSQEQSERVAHAMTMRGYGSNLSLPAFTPRLYDFVLLAITLALAGFFFFIPCAIV